MITPVPISPRQDRQKILMDKKTRSTRFECIPESKKVQERKLSLGLLLYPTSALENVMRDAAVQNFLREVLGQPIRGIYWCARKGESK